MNVVLGGNMEKAIFNMPEVKAYKDEPLESLLRCLNASRSEVNLPPLTFPRLQKMLSKIGKAKKNWDRDIFIGEVMDAKNPSSYFWYLVNLNKIK